MKIIRVSYALALFTLLNSAVALADISEKASQWEQMVREQFGKFAANYREPSPEEFLRGREFTAFLALDHSELALATASALQLRASKVEDLLIFEDTKARGWGQLVVRPGAKSGLIIEAPHPVSDAGTPQIAAQVFESLRADFLMIAGAHRRNRTDSSPDHSFHALSDMTHTEQSMFQAWHSGAVDEQSVVLQVHGFSSSRAHERFPDFPMSRQIVLSDGADDNYDSEKLRDLKLALSEAGFDVSIADFKSPAKSHLGARTNVQRRQLEESGLLSAQKTGEFIHMELSDTLRQNPELRAKLLDALRAWWCSCSQSVQTHRNSKSSVA